VQDSSTGIDYVFNYGTFEFSPEFYSQFVRGKLNYYLSVENYREFVYQYQVESRSIIEQVLQLNCTEKERLYNALLVNAQEQNKFYLYDFLYDNCTTRARDIVAKNTDTAVHFRNILLNDTPTFRNLIHSYLNAGNKYWSKLGIDMLLGAKLDNKVSNTEAMFLPDYLMRGFDSAVVGNKPLVGQKLTILELPSPFNSNALFTPFVVFTMLLVLVVFISFKRTTAAAKFIRIFDVVFFLILGLSGLLMLFMWFGTDHKVTQNNYNLLWALPAHLFVPLFIRKNFSGYKIYFIITLYVSLALLLLWFFLPQQMNNALLPIMLLVIFRSWHILKVNYVTKRN